MSEDCEHIAGKIKTLLERYELEAAVEVVESIVTRYQTPDDDPEKHQVMLLRKPSEFRVESPSEIDWRDTLEDRIKFRQGQLEILNETRRQIESGIASAKRTRRLERDKIRWEKAAERVSQLQTLDRQLGRAVASSGLRVRRTRCSLDWGLVEGDKERLAGNLLKEIEGKFEAEPDHVEQVCEIEDGMPVGKFGRITGLTRGRWSFIGSHVTWPDSSHPTTEKVFCSAKGTWTAFSLPGDSRAWVLNDKGHLAGIVVGGHLHNPWTYVTPISVIFEDIEMRLGCNVTFVNNGD